MCYIVKIYSSGVDINYKGNFIIQIMLKMITDESLKK